MYSQRQNLDLDAILDKAPTPNHLRPPSTFGITLAPIRKVAVKMIPNKENMINQNNEWLSQANNRNYDETNGNININRNMGQKGTMMENINININKKPLISPVRNPFKTQIENIVNINNNNGNLQQLTMPPTKLQQFNTNNNANMNNMNNINTNNTNNNAIISDSQMCVNHPNKSAEFNIDIEDECLAYCGRCAAQLASQGFEVNKIEAPTIKKGNRNISHHSQEER